VAHSNGERDGIMTIFPHRERGKNSTEESQSGKKYFPSPYPHFAQKPL